MVRGGFWMRLKRPCAQCFGDLQMVDVSHQVHTTTDAKDARAVKVEETHHTNEEAHLTHHGHVSAPFDSDSEGGDSEEIEFSVDFFAGSSSAGGAMLSSSQPSPVGVLQLNDIQQRHETTDSLATARNGAPKSDAVEPGQSAHHSAGRRNLHVLRLDSSVHFLAPNYV